jgi:hypothetical protein
MISDLVTSGRITAAQGAELLELRRDIQRSMRRRAFWRGFFDGITGGPLRRWIARRFR